MTAMYHAYTNAVSDGTATSVVRPSDWNSAHIQAQTLSGNTAGVSSFSGTNIVLQGGNNVTLSASTVAGAATIVISGANTSAQSVQTQASGAIAGTGFTSTTTSGTNVTAVLGTNGLSIAIPAFITTATQSTQTQASGGIAGTGFTSTTTSGTAITAALGTNGLSMAVPQYVTTYDATSGRAGTGTTLALTNLTGTLNVGTNGVALSLSGNAGGGGGGGGPTLQGSGTYTQSTGTIQFANSNGITFGLTSNQMTASVKTDYAGVGYTSTTQAGSTVGATLSTNGLSAAWPPFITTYVNDLTSGRAGTGFTSTSTAGTAITAALGTNGLSMAVPPFITTYVNDLTSGRAGTGFTSTTTGGTAITAALGTNGLSMAVPLYVTTYDATSGRAGTGTTLALTNLTGTLSVNTNGVALSLSGNAGGGGGGGVALQGSGTYTQSTGTVQFANSNGITFGLTSNQMTASVRTDYAATGYTSTTQAGSTVGVTQNGNGLSMAWPPFITTATQSVQTQASGAIAGTGLTTTTTAGSQVAGTLGTNGLNLAVPAYITTFASQTVQTQNLHNVTLSGNTSGTLAQVSSGTLTLAGGNNITLSQSGNAITISGPNTVAQSVQPVAVSASGGSSNFSTLVFTNSNGVTFTNTNGSIAVTHALQYTSNTSAITSNAYPASDTTKFAGTGTTLALTNASGTLAVNSNGVALSINKPDNFVSGWNLVGNTAGTTSTGLVTIAPIYLSGGNNVTLSGNSNTIVIAAAGGGGGGGGGVAVGVSNLGNTAGSTGTVSTGNVILVGTNGMVLSQSTGAAGSNATISIGPQLLSSWANNFYQYNSQTTAPRQSTSAIAPVYVANAITFDFLRMPLTVSATSTTNATTANQSLSFGVFYTFNVGIFSTNTNNSTLLKSVATTSAGLSHQISAAFNTNGGVHSVTNNITYPVSDGTQTFSASYSTSVTNFQLNSSVITAFTGMKHLEMPFAGSLPPNIYWMMLGVSAQTSTSVNAVFTRANIVHSNWGLTQPNNTWGYFGQAVSNTVQAIDGVGVFSTAGGGTVSELGFSNISSTASHVVPYFYLGA